MYQVCFQKVENPDKHGEGFKRNQELQNQRFIGFIFTVQVLIIYREVMVLIPLDQLSI